MSSFKIQYKWQEGSLPPPYYSEYTIRLDSKGVGEIVFQPDYSWNTPPIWQYSFEFSEESLQELQALLQQRKVLQREWDESTQHSVGGSLEQLSGSANDMQFSVPDTLSPEEAEQMAPIYRAIRAFVPANVWAKLRKEQEEYRNDYLQKKQ